MRSDLGAENLQDLVMSIKQVGILEPIVVTPRGDRWEVIAGHRRLTGGEIAGLDEMPSFIVGGTQEQLEMMKIHENLVRQDVNPWDEATHYARLIKDMKLSPNKIANLTNRSEQYVRNRLNILQMDEVLQHSVRDGKLNLAVAGELSRIKDPAKLREMVGWAIGHGITGAVAKKWVEEQMPQQRPIAGILPDAPGMGGIVPASEQHTDCFYCLEPVRLFDAVSVMVHDGCAQNRMEQAEAEAPPNTDGATIHQE